MGRNATPKIGEWRDGTLYRFRSTNGGPVLSASDGKMIVYERVRSDGETETLACFYADGLEDCLAAAFESGFHKGKKEGTNATRLEIQRALGLEANGYKIVQFVEVESKPLSLEDEK